MDISWKSKIVEENTGLSHRTTQGRMWALDFLCTPRSTGEASHNAFSTFLLPPSTACLPLESGEGEGYGHSSLQKHCGLTEGLGTQTAQNLPLLHTAQAAYFSV